jgi:hypothetical protein
MGVRELPFLHIGRILVDVFEKDLQVPSLGLDVVSLLVALALIVAGRLLLLQTFEIHAKLLEVAKQTLATFNVRIDVALVYRNNIFGSSLGVSSTTLTPLMFPITSCKHSRRGLLLMSTSVALYFLFPVKRPADMKQELVVLSINVTLGCIL